MKQFQTWKFSSFKAIKGVFDSTAIQKPKDIKEILTDNNKKFHKKTRTNLLLQCYHLGNYYSLVNYYWLPHLLRLGGELQL